MHSWPGTILHSLKSDSNCWKSVPLGKYCFQLLKCICLWLYRILRRTTQSGKWFMFCVSDLPFLLPGPSNRTTKLNDFSLSTSHDCRQMQASHKLPKNFFFKKNISKGISPSFWITDWYYAIRTHCFHREQTTGGKKKSPTKIYVREWRF